MKDTIPNARSVVKRMNKDPVGHIERVVKNELTQLELMLTEQDRSNQAVRLFFGASERIPTRALGYVASAIVAANAVGIDKLQVIAAVELGAMVNGLSSKKTKEEFISFANVAHSELALSRSSVSVAFATDTEESAELCRTAGSSAQAVLSGTPVMAKLHNRGEKHGGDALVYATGHFVYQDTDGLQPINVFGDRDSQKTVSSVVYVGCRQEEVFHEARTVLREKIDPASIGLQALSSVQVITKHTSAPYFNSNGSLEQHHAELSSGEPLISVHENPATQRDLTHLAGILHVQTGVEI